MKTLIQMKPLLASVMLGAALTIAPIAASAHSTSTSNVAVGTVITTDGMVRVAGATITAVTGNVINATTAFGSTILNWILNVSADTKIAANGYANASTTALKTGDSIVFKGNLTNSTSPLVVNAKTVVDTTSMKDIARITGTVASVDASANSLVITKKDGSPVTVNVDSATTIKIDGMATSTLGSIAAGDKVLVAGHLNAAGSVFGATRISAVGSLHRDKDQKEDNGDNDKDDSAEHLDKGLRLGAFLDLNHFFSLGK